MAMFILSQCLQNLTPVSRPDHLPHYLPTLDSNHIITITLPESVANFQLLNGHPWNFAIKIHSKFKMVAALPFAKSCTLAAADVTMLCYFELWTRFVV